MTEIVAFRIGRQWNMRLAPAASRRDWMDASPSGFANRCLPMRIASQGGWLILNDRAVRAKWLGGPAPSDVVVEADGAPPHAAIAHFGAGVLTFMLPFLFRTPPGVSLLLRGPPNAPKDAIGPLEALVETDWAVAAVSMNWKFTRPDAWVEFAAGEPICMIVPQRLDELEDVRPTLRELGSDPKTLAEHRAWHDSCVAFTERLRQGEPEAVKLAWQRFYFNGTAPHAAGRPIPQASDHRTRLQLRPFAEPDLAATGAVDDRAPTK